MNATIETTPDELLALLGRYALQVHQRDKVVEGLQAQVADLQATLKRVLLGSPNTESPKTVQERMQERMTDSLADSLTDGNGFHRRFQTQSVPDDVAVPPTVPPAPPTQYVDFGSEATDERFADGSPAGSGFCERPAGSAHEEGS